MTMSASDYRHIQKLNYTIKSLIQQAETYSFPLPLLKVVFDFEILPKLIHQFFIFSLLSLTFTEILVSQTAKC